MAALSVGYVNNYDGTKDPCYDTYCTADICPDGKPRRLYKGNCCSCGPIFPIYDDYTYFGIVLFILAVIATTRYFTKNKYVTNGMRVASAVSSGMMASYWFDYGLCASGLFVMGSILMCETGLYMGDYFYSDY